MAQEVVRTPEVEEDGWLGLPPGSPMRGDRVLLSLSPDPTSNGIAADLLQAAASCGIDLRQEATSSGDAMGPCLACITIISEGLEHVEAWMGNSTVGGRPLFILSCKEKPGADLARLTYEKDSCRVISWPTLGENAANQVLLEVRAALDVAAIRHQLAVEPARPLEGYEGGEEVEQEKQEDAADDIPFANAEIQESFLVAAEETDGPRVICVVEKTVRMNIMALGETGTGKTTFLRALFAAIVRNAKLKARYFPEDSAARRITEVAIDQLRQLRTHAGQATPARPSEGENILPPGRCQYWPSRVCQTVVLPKGVMADEAEVIIDFIDTPGYADTVDDTELIQCIEKYILTTFRDHAAVLKKNGYDEQADAVIQADKRPTVCFVFGNPTRFCKPVNMAVMEMLQPLVPIVPVLSKSDSLTPNERLFFLSQLKFELERQGITPYDFGEVGLDDSWTNHYRQMHGVDEDSSRCDSPDDCQVRAEVPDQDEPCSFAEEQQPTEVNLPLPRARNVWAVMGVDAPTSQSPYRRNTAGGRMEMMSPAHCDFYPLQSLFFEGNWHNMKLLSRKQWSEWQKRYAELNIVYWMAEEIRFHLGDSTAHFLLTSFAIIALGILAFWYMLLEPPQVLVWGMTVAAGYLLPFFFIVGQSKRLRWSLTQNRLSIALASLSIMLLLAWTLHTEAVDLNAKKTTAGELLGEFDALNLGQRIFWAFHKPFDP